MSSKRRSRPLYDGTTPALTPDTSLTEWQNEKRWLKSQLSAERRRHGSVEAVLTAHIATLEQQVADLRILYFQSLDIKAGQK
jgi:hypothetical protein